MGSQGGPDIRLTRDSTAILPLVNNPHLSL
jgi:hypothetical protein